jgi:hypothetical protein
LLVPEKIEEGERNRYSVGRFVSSCATISAEKACKEAAQNNQEGCAHFIPVPFIHQLTIPQPPRRGK